MAETGREKLIRQYAAREITWHDLREQGFDNYVQVFGALGDLACDRRLRRWKGRTSKPDGAAAR
jgi:hypothetical protein